MTSLTPSGKLNKSEEKPIFERSGDGAKGSSPLDIESTDLHQKGKVLHQNVWDATKTKIDSRSASLEKLLQAANNHMKTLRGFTSLKQEEKVKPYTFLNGKFYLPKELMDLVELDNYHSILVESIAEADIPLALTEGIIKKPSTDVDIFMKGFFFESRSTEIQQKSRMTKNQYTLGTMSYRYELHSKIANRASINYFYFHDLGEAVKFSLEMHNRSIFANDSSACNDTLKLIRMGIKSRSSKLGDDALLGIKRTPEEIWGLFRIKAKTVVKGKTTIKRLKAKKPWEYANIPKEIKTWLQRFTFLPSQEKSELFHRWATETNSENLSILWKEFSSLFNKYVTLSQKGRRLNNDYVREISKYEVKGRATDIEELYSRSKYQDSGIPFNILSFDRLQGWVEDTDLCINSLKDKAILRLREIYGFVDQ
jgi:hypothetical protein